MKVVRHDPALECTLKEFWEGFWSKQLCGIGETEEDAVKTFRGESTIKPKFRIPSADGESDVFFDSRELLCRFANFPTPTQANILRSIRTALNKNGVSRIMITIPWSKKGTRTVLVRASGAGTAVLDFELCP